MDIEAMVFLVGVDHHNNMHHSNHHRLALKYEKNAEIKKELSFTNIHI